MENRKLLILILMSTAHILTAQTGKVGINTLVPRAMFHVKDSSVLFSGATDISSNPGATSIVGTGVRLMWYADKAAFRSGRAVNDAWDAINIGNYSFASGNNVKASGDYATVFGRDCTASGNSAVAFGKNCVASADFSFAAGESSQSSGPNCHAIGFGCIAAGNGTLALGDMANSSGGYSMAIGSHAVSDGYTCMAIGPHTSASEPYSMALGFYSKVEGLAAIALGNEASAQNIYATAIGQYVKAKAYASTALGYGTQSNGIASFVVGAYNDTITAVENTKTPDSPLFILGNGNSSNELSNAMVVNYNGNTGIGTNYPLHRLHVKMNQPDVQLSRFSATGGYGEIVIDNATQVVDLGVTEDWGYVGTKTGNDFVIRTGAIERMTFKFNTGNVGIGTTSPNAKLEVNGSASKPGGGSWTAASDARLKQNVSSYTDGLSSLLKIRPVSFQYNSASGFDTDKQYIGIIAQELQTVAPYMVSTSTRTSSDGTADYLEVDNSSMMYMLINAVKEQQAIITQLEQRIVLLEKK